jgi:hypothetical protein
MYFKLLRADPEWLEEEIRKGNIFKKYPEGFSTCGEYTKDGISYYAMPYFEVMWKMQKFKNIYWRN